MNHRGPVPARVRLTDSHPDGLTLHANAKLARIVCYQISESVEEGHGGVNQTSRRVSKRKVLPRARHTVLLSVADQRCFEQNHSIRITVDVEEHLTILAMAGAGLQLIWAERVNVLVHNIYWLSGARPRVRLQRP